MKNHHLTLRRCHCCCRLLLLAILLPALIGCMSMPVATPAFPACLVEVNAGEQILPIKTAGIAWVVQQEGLEVHARFEATAVVLILNTKLDTRFAVVWEQCRFVWPDGRAEPVLGATPGLGAGQVGLREPTELTPGVPVIIALAPESRAGRRIFEENEMPSLAGKTFGLLLVGTLNGHPQRFELTFRISS